MSWQPPFPNILIVANGEPPSLHLFHSIYNGRQTIVAVDGGLQACASLGIYPHLIIGDFDSAPRKLLDSYPLAFQMRAEDQTKSDLEKTLEFLFSFPIEKVKVFGAFGKRFDQTFVNALLLCRYPGRIVFETDYEHCFGVNSSCEFPCFPGQTLSLLPLGEVVGLTTKGLKWELKEATLGKHCFGLSNVCLASYVFMHFESGDLIISLPKI